MTRTFRLLFLGTAVPLAALSGGAFAQTSEKPLDLAAITVIGTGLPTEILRNPASITVIDAAGISKSAPVSVATLLRDIPGVQVGEEGIERIAIRGEESRRVAILIDGQKLTDHTKDGQPVLVDPTTIERIEVVRGSSSVVSGSRAIGGVVNIVTKAGADKPLSLTASAGYISATKGTRASITAAGSVAAGAGAFDYRLSYGRMEQGNRQTPEGELARSATSDRNLSGHLGYRVGNHALGLKATRYDLSAEVYTGDPAFIIDLPHRDLRKTGLFYEGKDLAPWLTRLTFDAYHQTIDRDFRNNVTVPAGPGMSMRILSTSVDKQTTSGVNLRAEMALAPGSRTVAGLEYEDDRLTTDKSSSRLGPFGPPATTLRYDEASVRTLSLFAQHEHELSQTLTATIGARWYRVEASHDASRVNGGAAPLSAGNSDSLAMASAGLVWAPAEDFALRANISQGYIYPTLGQLFLTTTAGGTTVQGNPDLKPERSTTFELGARLDRAETLLDATLFYSDSKDYIANLRLDARNARYANVDRAKSWGIEVYAEQRLDSGLTPYASLALIRCELTFASGLSTFDSGAPRVSGKIGVRQDWATAGLNGTVDLFLRGESAVRFRNASDTVTAQSSGWATLNLRGDVDFGNGLSMVAEVNNLTNRSYQPYNQMPGAERSVNLFLTKSF